MSIVAIVVVLSLLVLVAVALATVVHRDGYGTLPPPRSHPAWDEGTTLAGPRLV
jgi:hypothetical protein